MDIARLNFSHGSHDFHRKLIETIRAASKKAGRPIAIMQDLQGPKLRAGKLGPGGVELRKGDILLLHPEDEKPKGNLTGKIRIPISSEIARAVSKDAKIGARILFDDGKIQTHALEIKDGEIIVEVDVGGKLSDHKGMNLPGTPLTLSCLTDKDLIDLEFGLEMGVDAVALSFVRSPRDMTDLKERILKKNPAVIPWCVAKIEREEAIECQDDIIEVSDGLLVARGDMAVEIGAEHVPVVQKRLIQACNRLGVPIITATQMLESMIQSPTPTRAEASDVANAVFDGTDAVMLSGETASGMYPREAVETMARIVVEAEKNREHNIRTEILPIPGSTVDSIEFSASRVAHHTGATAIACLTHSGMAARTLAKFRPETPIVAIMDNETVLRKLSFVWGVQGVLIPKILGTDDVFQMVEKALLDTGWVEAEDVVVITAGVPTLRRGTTNTIKVHRIGAQAERARPSKAL